MTENIDQYVLHGLKHASSRTESTGKHRKCVIWFLVIMVSMQHLQFGVSHQMDSISSELDHIEGASIRNWEVWPFCHSWNDRENFLCLLCFHQMAMRAVSGFHCRSGKPETSCFGFCWHEWCVETNLLHSVMIKDVEKLATHFTSHPSCVQRAR